MNRPAMLLVFLGAASFLVWDHMHPEREPLAPPPPPALSAGAQPGPVFSEDEIKKVRLSLQDSDSSVRWAAIQLLFSIRDPQLGPSLERMLTEDPDPEVRMKVVSLFKGREDMSRLGPLVRSLGDYDANVRMASLQALGDIGDPSVTVWVTALLRDVEPAVRIEALRTLGRFQDKRKAEFKALADKLRADYEEAVRRAAARR
ncbi:MAG: HEAT repeat domain-containing protein [Elusimicrobia bacterium]|nr:HEAT repeat domain-containing protein [Elusimicrobiota bacterium]